MIKRTYAYSGKITVGAGYRPFCGVVDTISWFEAPRKTFNQAIKDIAESSNTEIKDVIIIVFNRV